MNLTDYRTLGRSGLIVSPLALGTMTFGTGRWGASPEVSGKIFGAYVEAGGNFVDTADVYAGGESERLVGRFIAERKMRDEVVLATKYGFNASRGQPHAGGNGRKHVRQALEASLKRLGTDYVDLYWMHVWDMVTPVEETVQTLGDLVREGLIRYYAFSDLPAWYGVKAQALSQVHGVPGPVALQLEYSLVARQVEAEHVSGAREAGLGLVPWSPLAGGFLSGKYNREQQDVSGRLSGSNPFGNSKFTEANWRTLDALKEVAAEVNRPPAQVALAWVVGRPGVTSTLIGASKVEQLQDNLAALELRLSPAQTRTLTDASVTDPNTPEGFFSPDLRRMVFGGVDVEGWH